VKISAADRSGAPYSRPPRLACETGGQGGGVREARARARDLALSHLARIQGKDGGFKGDYGGPLFLLPMYVGTAFVVGARLDDRTRDGMIRYLDSAQNKDGGFGLHTEGASMVFTSVIIYVALRLLGVGREDPRASAALRYLRSQGGPLYAAAWGKFFLSILGLYDYRGVDPVLPELWLLPESLPVHPSRLWCHCRMVYLPMSWLYGRKARVAESELLSELRSELYEKSFDEIDWEAHRATVAAPDAQVPRTPLVHAVNRALSVFESHHPEALRERALDFVLAQIRMEDKNTNYICIGPVNKLMNVLVWHFANPKGPELRAHLQRLPDYLFEGQTGVKMNGYNSSELWDTAFAVQAIVASGRTSEHADMLSRAYEFIDRAQVREDVDDRAKCFRHASKGGWPFSTRAHGWPISDCTALGVLAVLDLETAGATPFPEERLAEAIDIILSMQNKDGGWATYELTRGPAWLERFNPSDCFADIMVDYSYVECTSACVQALSRFRARYPSVRAAAVSRAIERGVRAIRASQREDGSWEGSWGVCFTYGTWFAVSGLVAAGARPGDESIERACSFLLAHQSADGSWGETAESCRLRRYVQAERGQAVMTAWAALTLIAAGRGGTPDVDRALDFLVARQLADGSYPEEHTAGMFNKTCAIHYDHYLDIFPLWALSVGESIPPRIPKNSTPLAPRLASRAGVT
jgi:squalene/oxidosqualene cyclase-like protein